MWETSQTTVMGGGRQQTQSRHKQKRTIGSSTSRESSDNSEVRFCYCEVQAAKRTSRTERNPLRDFYTRAKANCIYFTWADEEDIRDPAYVNMREEAWKREVLKKLDSVVEELKLFRYNVILMLVIIFVLVVIFIVIRGA